MFDTYKNNSAKKIYSKLLGSTFGHIAFASFFIAVLSGVFLAIPFNVAKPFDSISIMLLINHSAEFIRSLHYWSAQIFLIFIILHIWDHLRKSTEKKVKSGIWLRLSISLVAIFLVMLTGFILKGDADSNQAARILTNLIEKIPFIGKYISYSLVGKEGDYQLVYIHHIATFTIFIWLIIIEHVRLIWPKIKTFVLFIIPIIILSFVFPAALHNNLNPVMKGPWYFLGLQELFHYFSRPEFVILFFLLVLIAVYYLPKMKDKSSHVFKYFIFWVAVLYTVLIIIGYFFRGENWEFVMPWNNEYFTEFTSSPANNYENYFADFNSGKEIPKILEQREGCRYCHSDVKGFAASHSPEAIGCASCHLGSPFSLSKNAAHTGMIKIPGNLKTAKLTCGNSKCHPNIPERVDNLLMTTMSGIISVDRFTFGETDSLNQIHKIENIGQTAADTHLRNLCASCHLGNNKTEYGEINQQSRGGGCNACHLNYSDSTKSELKNYLTIKDNKLNKFHPSLSLNVSNEHCFGCHSRSGRISLNYEGWHETQFEKDEIPKDGKFRILEDGRVVKFIEEDIHHQKGLECIDCHNSYELMGDGTLYAHEEDQTRIQCEDCHSRENNNVLTLEQMDEESQKIIKLRKFDIKGRKYLATRKNSVPLINTYQAKSSEFYLIGKNSGKFFPLNPPKSICVEGKAHSSLNCNSCHTSWAPRCVGCHTEFVPDETGFDHLTGKDTKGKWVESIGEFYAELPTLGVVINKDSVGEHGKVATFIPGMILTVDKSKFSGKAEKEIFKRMFAPSFPHTTSARGRSCKSCHNNPVAIGYGRGELKYEISGGKGIWKFIPSFVNDEHDELPQDAWIGFLDSSNKGASTRTNARAFNIAEQQRILTVGACLTCHKDDSKVMQQALTDFDWTMKFLSDKCIVPNWN